RVAALAVQWDCDERLKPLLLELWHVLHSRVVECVLADERRPALRERPPREALAALQLDAAGEMCVRCRRGAEHESLSVAVEEVHEARVNGAGVGEQPDYSFQDLLEVERGADRRDDLVEEALFACCRRPPGDDLHILLIQRREWKG